MSHFWQGRPVLVTGCTGFIGSRLTQELIRREAKVVGLIRDMIPNSPLFIKDSTNNLFNKLTLAFGKVEDLTTLKRIINEYSIDTIFHLAAQSLTNIANRDPIATFEANIRGTWNLLEASREIGGVTRIIIASSDKAYGDQEILPYYETTPLKGEHPYDVSKSCVDLISRAYFVSYNLPVCITRCGNLFGGGDLNLGRIIPKTIISVLNDKPIVIRSDGSYTRDYFYVVDGVQAYLHLAEQMDRSDILGEAFNFGTGVQLSVLEVVDQILNSMDRNDLEIIKLNQAQNEIKHQCLSIEKARTMLNWTPHYTFAESLKETIQWYKLNYSLL